MREAGKRGLILETKEPHESLYLHNYVAQAVDIPAEYSVSPGLTEWEMLGNDQYGDCGPAATEHYRMAKAFKGMSDPAGGVPLFEKGFKVPTTAETLALYFAYGRAMGEPGQQPDEGVENSSWLQWLFETGVIDAYAFIDVKSPGVASRVRSAVTQFDGALVGLTLTDNAKQLFEDGECWALDGESPDPNEGHDVLYAGWKPGGDIFITWGAPQCSTTNWDKGCVDSAAVIVTKEDAGRLGISSEKYAALQAAIRQNGGSTAGCHLLTPHSFHRRLQALEQGILSVPDKVRKALDAGFNELHDELVKDDES